jgi:hypothetical protein
VERLGPDLVVCSRLTARVVDHAPRWGRGWGAYSVVSVLGERSTVDEIQLSDLLSIMNRTKRSRYLG